MNVRLQNVRQCSGFGDHRSRIAIGAQGRTLVGFKCLPFCSFFDESHIVPTAFKNGARDRVHNRNIGAGLDLQMQNVFLARRRFGGRHRNGPTWVHNYHAARRHLLAGEG